MKRIEPNHLRSFDRPFDWDHSTQGMVFHRTLEAAFGPGAVLSTDDDRPVNWSLINYCIAASIVLATIALWFAPLSP